MRRQWLSKLAEGPRSCHSWSQNTWCLCPQAPRTWGRLWHRAKVAHTCHRIRCRELQLQKIFLKPMFEVFSKFFFPCVPSCSFLQYNDLYLTFLSTNTLCARGLCLPLDVPCSFSSSPHSQSSLSFLLTQWISLSEVESFVSSLLRRRLFRQLIC